VCERLETLPEWQREAIHALLNTVATEFGVKLGNIAQPVRVAVTGSTVSPPIDVTVYLIGRARSVKRLKRALEMLS